MTVALNPSRRFVEVPDEICLEKGVTYDVRVTFVRKSLNGRDSLFTDSVWIEFIMIIRIILISFIS